ncbi:MAG TPA: hypothetical protein PKC59_08960 [Burkholderiaceae bacterium]|nr:hypothetical protein [Burkholderiaceae bacterium]HMY99482.1 hypothetical protein [Burkholderiaceae bacterium]HNB44031.1 hypothetical protein [Burkholderiaceae bacterium]HNG79225.1 hypothetical protein [Burkholderiaceae bacterium]
MLTVHATLLPNGQVQLPPGLAKARPVPVLVTILEPVNDAAQPPEPGHVALGTSPEAVPTQGSIANLMALLASPTFQSLPKADPQELEAHIQALRNDWNDD